MPWTSIIMALISFLLSKKSGASTGRAAAIGAAAGLATYYIADPVNKNNLLGLTFGQPSKEGQLPTKTNAGATNESQSVAIPSTLGTLGSTVITESAGVLKSWGPTGTLGVVAGTTAVKSDFFKDNWIWIAGVVALLVLRK